MSTQVRCTNLLVLMNGAYSLYITMKDAYSLYIIMKDAYSLYITMKDAYNLYVTMSAQLRCADLLVLIKGCSQLVYNHVSSAEMH